MVDSPVEPRGLVHRWRAAAAVMTIGTAGAAAVALYSGGAGADFPQPSAREIKNALVEEQSGHERLRIDEIILERATVRAAYPLHSNAVVVVRGVNSMGAARTMIAKLAYEDGIGWYVQEAWDRPGGQPAWATFASDGDHVVVWDGLAPGQHLLHKSTEISDESAGIAAVASSIATDEVTVW